MNSNDEWNKAEETHRRSRPVTATEKILSVVEEIQSDLQEMKTSPTTEWTQQKRDDGVLTSLGSVQEDRIIRSQIENVLSHPQSSFTTASVVRRNGLLIEIHTTARIMQG